MLHNIDHIRILSIKVTGFPAKLQILCDYDDRTPPSYYCRVQGDYIINKYDRNFELMRSSKLRMCVYNP